MSRRKLNDVFLKEQVENKSNCKFNSSYIKVTKNNSKVRMNLTCGCGKVFEVEWVKFNRKDGRPQRQCQDCGNRLRVEKSRMTDEEYIQLKKEKGIEIEHLEKADGKSKKIRHKCPICESKEWYALPKNILNKASTKCSSCHLASIGGINKYSDEDYQRLKNEKGIKIKNTEEYIDNSTPIYHTCPECNIDVKVRPNKVLGDWSMCEPCSYVKRGEGRMRTDAEVKAIVEEFGGKWIGGEYLGKDSVLTFECECGSEFNKRFSDFSHGWVRCSKCADSISTGEYSIQKWLLEKGLNFTPQKKFDELRGKRNMPLFYDFSIDDENGQPILLIEYDGEHHFKPMYYRFPTKAKAEQDFERVKKYDEIKNEFADSKNIPIIRLSSKDYEKLDIKLKHLL